MYPDAMQPKATLVASGYDLCQLISVAGDHVMRSLQMGKRKGEALTMSLG